MKSPTEEDPIILRNDRDYRVFAQSHLLNRNDKYTGLGGMTDSAYLAHVKTHFGAPSSYPAMVWITVSEAAEEVGPTFPQTHVHFQTKKELKDRLAEFDK